MNKRWLLMNPPTGKYIRDTRCQASVNDIIAISDRPPVDLAYIAGSIKVNGDDCIIRDYPAERYNRRLMIEDIKNLDLDYVVINTTMFTYQDDLDICKIIKSIDKNIITIAKGAVFFHNPADIMKDFPFLDIAVSGEEEQTFGELAMGKELTEINNITFRSNCEIISNPIVINPSFSIAKPCIDLINHKLYKRPDTNEMQASIVVGRGCPGKCIYCIAPLVGGSTARYRDIDDVINEINDYYCKYNIKNFYFTADSFTWNKQWVIEFCSRISSLPYKIEWLCNSRIDRISDDILQIMKNAGCWGISIGIESGNEKIQEKIKKGLKKQQVINAVNLCRKYRIVCLLHFIIGFPWDSRETIMETIRFAKKFKGNIIEFYIATPLKGTEFYEIVEKETLLNKIDTSKGLNYVTATADTFYLSINELARLREKAIKSIYMNPLFYIKSLIYIRSFKQLFNCSIFIIKKMFFILLKQIKTERRRELKV